MDKQKMMSANEKPSSLCRWLNPLKYHHDMSIVALFATLDLKKTDVDRDGFPGYASCVLIELWRRAENDTPYIKILYRRENEELLDLTDQISGCAKDCPLEQDSLSHPLQYRPLDSGTSGSIGLKSKNLTLILFGVVIAGWLKKRFM
uniref:Uncharacterized protein n=1 Tax=Ditylenchus dipsaci TaxID=166011 RepID=A0A915DU73_9BILA